MITLFLIREYAVGTESYELGFPRGLIDPVKPWMKRPIAS